MNGDHVANTAAQGSGELRKPVWRTPSLTSDLVSGVTRLNYAPGIDSLFEGSSPATGS